MNQNLSIPILPAIKLLIRLRRFVNPDLVRDDKGGLGATGNDHVAQVAVVLLDVALACADCQTLSIISTILIFFALGVYFFKKLPKRN
jgi:hypothetical protein